MRRPSGSEKTQPISVSNIGLRAAALEFGFCFSFVEVFREERKFGAGWLVTGLARLAEAKHAFTELQQDFLVFALHFVGDDFHAPEVAEKITVGGDVGRMKNDAAECDAFETFAARLGKGIEISESFFKPR